MGHDVWQRVWPAWLPLIPGVIAVSWAAIIIRACNAPSTAIAFYRMFGATLLLAPFALTTKRHTFREFNQITFYLGVAAGSLLGWHFFFWVRSLEYTTIPASVVLVTTQPVFVALWARLFLREPIGARGIAAIIMAIVGSALIAGFDLTVKKEYLYGDLLALAGAVMAGTYLFLGRLVRASVSTVPYVFTVYSVSALTLALMTALEGQLLRIYSPANYFYFLLLALVPTVLGHSLYNYSLRHVAAHKVGVSIVGEPVLATVWAMIIFREVPRLATVLGGLIIIMALILVFSGKEKPCSSVSKG